MPWLEDLKSAFEAWLVAALIFWFLPKLMFAESPARNLFFQFFSRFTRTTLLTVVAVIVLSGLHIFNAGTLTIFYGLALSAFWVCRNGLSAYAVREWFLTKVRWVEDWYKRGGWMEPFGFRWRLLVLPDRMYIIPVVGAGLVTLLLVIEVRLWLPLHGLRFACPDAYVHLLRVRELIHDVRPFAQPLVLPSMLATVSSLAAVDAMQVTRFLPPLLDVLLAITSGITVAAIFRCNWIGVFTAFVVGCYTERSVASEGTIGTFFLLLTLAFLADYYYHAHRSSLYDVICALSLLVLSLPEAFPREVVLTLFLSCTLALFARLLHRWIPAYHLQALLPLLVMVGVFVWAPPTFPRPHFLEYEATARQSLRIISAFPAQRWAIVAPSEQFPETFGYGQYEDLFQFVSDYHDRVSDPNFHFPFHTLFVFVEKRPFQYFTAEPTFVSFSILTDPTYRNYRSPAGRSSLELATMKLCEAYSDVHPNGHVFYEDQDLRVYQFQN